MNTKEFYAEWFKSLQDDITTSLEIIDGSGTRFHQDIWERAGGGGGRTRIFTNGSLIEKGGVNFSAVYGDASPRMLSALQITHDGSPQEFFASGVSLVLHPHSPLMPIIHMNVRYFELSSGIWWFGGGIDLTPHYITPPLAKCFHQHLKSACDKHNPDFYPAYKTWADEYFYLPHRNETRGIGGIFFDRLGLNEPSDKAPLYFDFVKEVGNAFIPAYAEQAEACRDLPYTDHEVAWQMLRRGRYVEYNLIHDRGTKFGLESDGRTESILMSLPPVANWTYNYQPAEGSQEAETLNLLRKGIDWLDI